MLECAFMKQFLVSLPLLFLISVFVHGQEASKPDFSGKWIFNAQKSTLQDPAPSSMTLYIDEHDPSVRFSRTQVYGDKTDTWSLDARTDDEREIVQHAPLYTSRIRVYWDGDALVLDEKIIAGDGSKATNMVRYTLEAGGKTLVGVENEKTPVGKSTNKWVYDKQPR